MKSILLSIKPEWLCKILNGEKTIEVRKKFPKDYVGWVYLYCSKSGGTLCPSYKPDNTMRYTVIKDKYDDVLAGYAYEEDAAEQRMLTQEEYDLLKEVLL